MTLRQAIKGTAGDLRAVLALKLISLALSVHPEAAIAAMCATALSKAQKENR